ncbi:hypothetical protein M406DRAFT_105820 [Cryphonectria parasitica EP155]|uniref:Uncharacterized protein n=1 Tax=Cryphonectria parasitica (strain ATCC 38755 / EP155) TaxID=660469 RepID=A0A9P4Y3G1_CRYP1|nr:uncharacterized protein M406DRAFT_105820 [Cryphonectria parasitica EP155]KAF3765435.1 hypothetical protein M406DRAFT_105820 [Cryphonectria parasitica EP155]
MAAPLPESQAEPFSSPMTPLCIFSVVCYKAATSLSKTPPATEIKASGSQSLCAQCPMPNAPNGEGYGESHFLAASLPDSIESNSDIHEPDPSQEGHGLAHPPEAADSDLSDLPSDNPNQTPDIIPPNMNLNTMWRMGEPLERGGQRHAQVYSVVDVESGRSADGLEAHVFVLDRSQPEIRKHRLRCIKRMSRRAQLEVQVHNAVIVVISTSEGNAHQAPFEEGQLVTTESSKEKDVRKKVKTPYQRECARVRQLEKRRFERAAQHASTAVGESLKCDETEATLFLVLLYILYDADGSMRETMTPDHVKLLEATGSGSLHGLLETYMSQVAINFKAFKDMEAYSTVKLGEISSLQRLQGKLSSIDQEHHDKLLQIIHEQAQHPKGSAPWREIQYGRRAEAFTQLRLARHAKSVLPKVLDKLETLHKANSRRLALAREGARVKSLQDRLGRLSETVTQLEKWMGTVFPLSSARDDLFHRWEAAKVNLTEFKSKHPLIELPSGSDVNLEEELLRMTLR